MHRSARPFRSQDGGCASRRNATALAVLAWCLAAAPAAAQLDGRLGAGVTWSTALLEDSITQPVTLLPRPAFTMAAAVGHRLAHRTRLVASLRLLRAGLVRRRGGASTTILTLVTLAPGMSVERDLPAGFAASAGAGAIVYAPSISDGTLFRDGRPIRPMLLAGLAWRRTFGRVEGGLGVLYDLHGFTTRALAHDGFEGARLVHRGGITMTFGWR